MVSKLIARKAKQFCSIREIKSEVEEIKEGVPQGGHLALTLYLIYTENLKNLPLHGKLFLYADDTTILHSGYEINNIQNNINDDLKQIETWMTHHQLTINTTKTKYMIIHNNKNLNINIKYKNETLEKVLNFKYLGIWFDHKMSWEIHTKYLKSKLSAIAGILKKIGKVTLLNSLLPIYHSMFQSHILYGLPVWTNITKKNVSCISVIQNKAIRNVFNLKKTTRTYLLYKKNNLLPFEELMNISILIHTHNIINNFILSNTYFERNNSVHAYSTRSSNNLRQYNINSAKFGTTSIRN